MTFAYGTAVTVRRGSPGGFNAYGDPVSGSTTDTVVAGCAVAPRYSTEPTERGRQGVVVGLTVYAPAGTDIVSTDRILIAGVEYTIDGQPAEWSHPMTGWAPGLEVAITRAVG